MAAGLVPRSAVFLFGRMLGPDSIGAAGGYAIDISVNSYLNHMNSVFGEIVYAPGSFNDTKSILLMTLSLALVCYTKRRHLVFAWLFVTLGVLPVAFIQPKGMYLVYLPLLGIAFLAASLLVGVANVVERRLTTHAVIVLGLTCMLGAAQYAVTQRTDYGTYLEEESREIRSVLDQLRDLHPAMPQGSRILFLKDPFLDQPRWEIKSWATVFVVSLLYGDVQIERVLPPNPPPPLETLSEYDFVFTADGLRLIELHPATGAPK